MKTGQLSIHSENILPIIKRWLYSEKDIFVRELASNASDAIQKRIILQNRGEAPVCPEHRIDVRIDPEKKALTFSDTGLGMNAEEAEKFLAQIAFSGAEEFIKTYELNDTFIGHFGLGFFSAFMVADKIEVRTKSYRPSDPAIVWSSTGSTEFSITPAEREAPGTDVTLFLGPDQHEYLEESTLNAVLKRFCGFFPFPVFLNGKKINEHEPLWKKRPSECTEEEYLNFYSSLYPFEDPPLFWVHLNVEYPFHVQGILYFPKFRKDIELSKGHVRLFCNRVFVSDDCKDILPDYLTLLRGVLDSHDIPLNVSRSHLQVDSTVRQLATHISKKVADALCALFRNDREKYVQGWPAYEHIIKFGMLQDEKFRGRAKEFLLWKISEDGWKTADELARDLDGKKTIVYCDGNQEGSALVKEFTSKGVRIAVVTAAIDPPLMSRLEREDQLYFKRIDAAVESLLLNPSKEKTILDASGRTEAAKIADFFRETLQDDSLQIEAKSLDAENIPAILTLEEEERRFRDYMSKVSNEKPFVKPKVSFIVNTNSPLIQSLYKARSVAPDLSKELAAHLYDLTRLSHQELPSHELHTFAERSTRLLERFSGSVLQKAEGPVQP